MDDFVVPSEFDSQFAELDIMFSRITWRDIAEHPSTGWWVQAAPNDSRLLVQVFIDKVKLEWRMTPASKDMGGEVDVGDRTSPSMNFIAMTKKQQAEEFEGKGDYQAAADEYQNAAELYSKLRSPS